MDTFKTVAPAAAVTDSVVTEGRPGGHTSQHVVSVGGNIGLRIAKDAKRQICSI
jgi:hypothetical protein